MKVAAKCNFYFFDMGRDPKGWSQEARKNGTFIFDMMSILFYEMMCRRRELRPLPQSG
jgi:hypothetical protein